MSSLQVQQSDWVLDGNTVKKQYRYEGLTGSASEHKVQIDVDFSQGVFGHINTHIFILIYPSLFPDASGHLGAQLSVSEGDPAKNAPLDLDTPIVPVSASHSDDGVLIVGPASTEAISAFHKTLAAAVGMQLTLLDKEEIILVLPIPNDPQFLEVYKMGWEMFSGRNFPSA